MHSPVWCERNVIRGSTARSHPPRWSFMLDISVSGIGQLFSYPPSRTTMTTIPTTTTTKLISSHSPLFYWQLLTAVASRNWTTSMNDVHVTVILLYLIAHTTHLSPRDASHVDSDKVHPFAPRRQSSTGSRLLFSSYNYPRLRPRTNLPSWIYFFQNNFSMTSRDSPLWRSLFL